MFNAKTLASSINTSDERLVTMECTYPRFIHSEVKTHRMWSTNSASSRAIPVQKMIDNVMKNPVIPIHWGAAQKGMQADVQLDAATAAICKKEWLTARDNAVRTVEQLLANGLHKQIANRLLEPWMWITTIISFTSFEHFRRLRCHPAAEPHFQILAHLMADAYDSSTPRLLQDGEWHLPLVGFPGDEDLCEMDKVRVSTARCARVSYLTHAGTRDVAADLTLHDSLSTNGHWSPFEHPAQAKAGVRSGNFTGFIQYRKHFQNEFVHDLVQSV